MGGIRVIGGASVVVGATVVVGAAVVVGASVVVGGRVVVVGGRVVVVGGSVGGTVAGGAVAGGAVGGTVAGGAGFGADGLAFGGNRRASPAKNPRRLAEVLSEAVVVGFMADVVTPGSGVATVDSASTDGSTSGSTAADVVDAPSAGGSSVVVEAVRCSRSSLATWETSGGDDTL